MKEATNRVLHALEITGMALALLTLFLIMISIAADAFGRYFLSAPLRGQYEFTSLYLMVILSFMGLARTQALGGHIAISVMSPTLDRIPYKLVPRIMSLLAAAAFGFITVLAGEEALARIAARTTTFGAVQFPTYLSYCWVPLGTGILTLRAAASEHLADGQRTEPFRLRISRVRTNEKGGEGICAFPAPKAITLTGP